MKSKLLCSVLIMTTALSICAVNSNAAPMLQKSPLKFDPVKWQLESSNYVKIVNSSTATWDILVNVAKDCPIPNGYDREGIEILNTGKYLEPGDSTIVTIEPDHYLNFKGQYYGSYNASCGTYQISPRTK